METDAAQFAAGQRRLEHIARVERALGLAGADNGMKLVDEENDLPFAARQILEHRLETLFKIAAEASSSDQRTEVERQQLLALQALGHLAVNDALRQPLGNGCLADAGLADEYRVVLDPPRQHLYDAANFIVAADHRIKFALFSPLGQIDGVFLQGLALLLGAGIFDRDPDRARPLSPEVAPGDRPPCRRNSLARAWSASKRASGKSSQVMKRSPLS